MDGPFPFSILNHKQNRQVKNYFSRQVTGPIEMHITIWQKKYWLNKFKMRRLCGVFGSIVSRSFCANLMINFTVLCLWENET